MEVYSFRKEGRGLASQIDKYVDDKFSILINPKDGQAIAKCVDPREKRMLEFVVPILYPKKPSRNTMTVGNTIFGALSKVRKISWGLVIQEVVGKLVSRLEKGKPSTISPYLFHLYHRFECLRREEMETIDIAKHILEYSVSPEVEMQSNVVGLDLDRESLSSAEQRKVLASSPSFKKKQTYWVLQGRKLV